MGDRQERKGRRALLAWNSIPARIRGSIRGLGRRDLDLRGGSEGWSIRENVHHLVEANLVASSMIIAALATNGCDFDWTWVNPGRPWMRCVGYDKADVGPAIAMLRALCRHISPLVAGRPRALTRRVRLNDSPGVKRYDMMVGRILRQEVEHADDHIAEIRAIRRRHGR